MRVKMSKQPPPAPTASAVGPCPTVIQIVGRPGTRSLPSTNAPPDHPLQKNKRLSADGRKISRNYKTMRGTATIKLWAQLFKAWLA